MDSFIIIPTKYWPSVDPYIDPSADLATFTDETYYPVLLMTMTGFCLPWIPIPSSQSPSRPIQVVFNSILPFVLAPARPPNAPALPPSLHAMSKGSGSSHSCLLHESLHADLTSLSPIIGASLWNATIPTRFSPPVPL